MSEVLSQPDEVVTLPELSERRKLKLSWLYSRSRFDKLPGQRRYGRHIRVVLSEFDQATKEGVLAT